MVRFSRTRADRPVSALFLVQIGAAVLLLLVSYLWGSSLVQLANPVLSVIRIEDSVEADHSDLSSPRLGKEAAKARVETIHDSQAHPIQVSPPKNDAEVPTAYDDLSQKSCQYRSLLDLSPYELTPVKGPRHMVQPPTDVGGGELSLVCCRTTAGPLPIVVHKSWAPLGAERFLSMVNVEYFSSRVPLMRCVKNWLCQFGIAGDPAVDKIFNKRMNDDPQWLPLGPDHRKNSEEVNRFARGYLAYAGSGPNSRTNQFIVALQNNGPLGGGNPWEVPWGEVVGTDGMQTLDMIYTGYGENGPPQGLLHREGSSEDVVMKWPKLDYIVGCELLEGRKV